MTSPYRPTIMVIYTALKKCISSHHCPKREGQCDEHCKVLGYRGIMGVFGGKTEESPFKASVVCGGNCMVHGYIVVVGQLYVVLSQIFV